MHFKMPGQFVERPGGFDGFQGHFGLKFPTVFFACLFHSAVYCITFSSHSPPKPPVQFSGSTIPDGDVTVVFTGTLQSASAPTGPFVDVPGHPQGTFTIPKVSLGAQQYFRAQQ
jgi:hypothetical protein